MKNIFVGISVGLLVIGLILVTIIGPIGFLICGIGLALTLIFVVIFNIKGKKTYSAKVVYQDKKGKTKTETVSVHAFSEDEAKNIAKNQYDGVVEDTKEVGYKD